MLDNPFGEEIFPKIQSKPSLVQIEAVPFQVVVESDKVSPQPPLL